MRRRFKAEGLTLICTDETDSERDNGKNNRRSLDSASHGKAVRSLAQDDTFGMALLV